MNKIIGYKGFDEGLKCRDFQFEIGKTYKHDGPVVACQSGFHFCERPMDVWEFYGPRNEFCVVEAVEGIKEGTKSVTGEITIQRKISIKEMVDITVSQILAGIKETKTGDGEKSAATNTGDRSAATNTGVQSAATNTGGGSAATNTGSRSAATNTGYKSAASNTGDYSAATNTGENGVALCTGTESKSSVEGANGVAISTGSGGMVKGSLGCWIVLTEKNSDSKILSVIGFEVDNTIIKENTYYKLVNKLPVEVQ